MVEERTSYLVVGVFVLVATAAAVAFTVWIAGGRNAVAVTPYTVMFDRDISGLSPGSPVRYLGVDVGEVVAMQLITDIETRVSVDISIAAATPVDQGTYASLAYLGITGVAFINLAADPGGFPPLVAGPSNEYPVIQSRDVGLAALFAQSGDIVADVDALLSQASSLLGEENQRYLSSTLANFEMLSNTLINEQDTLARIPQQLVVALDDLRGMVDQVQGLLARAEPDLLAVTSQLNQATADIAQLSNRIDAWFASNEESLDNIISAGLNELPVLLAETRGTMRELEKLLADVREDPSQIIYRPQRSTVTVDP